MTAETGRRRSGDLGDTVLTRWRRRMVSTVAVLGLAALGGWLGDLLAPILDRVIVGGLAVLVLSVLAYAVVDFFRSMD